MAKKIVLLNPPSPFLVDQKAFPPLGLLYLGAQLKQKGYSVEVRDLSNCEMRLDEELSSVTGDVIGITASTPQYDLAVDIAHKLRLLLPAALLVVGGSHASSAKEACLSDGFDTVVVGEGENAIVDVAEVGLTGVVTRPYVIGIDSLPLPDRSLIDINSYGYSIDGHRATTIITSRGCPFECAFCSKDVWSRSLRFHGVDRVEAEIDECISKYGFKHFLFLDDSMAFISRRLIKICDMLVPKEIKWRAYVRSKGMTLDTLRAMKAAGCVEVGIGVESGDQRILDMANKGTTVEDNSRMIELCRQAGILSNVFIMIGLPGEDLTSVSNTQKWMRENRPDKFGYNIFTPYLGTPIANNLSAFDLQTYPMPNSQSWVKGSNEDDYRSFVATLALSRDEILRLFKENFKAFEEITGWNPRRKR